MAVTLWLGLALAGTDGGLRPSAAVSTSLQPWMVGTVSGSRSVRVEVGLHTGPWELGLVHRGSTLNVLHYTLLAEFAQPTPALPGDGRLACWGAQGGFAGALGPLWLGGSAAAGYARWRSPMEPGFFQDLVVEQSWNGDPGVGIAAHGAFGLLTLRVGLPIDEGLAVYLYTEGGGAWLGTLVPMAELGGGLSTRF